MEFFTIFISNYFTRFPGQNYDDINPHLEQLILSFDISSKLLFLSQIIFPRKTGF